MIIRYSREEMAKIWSDEFRYDTWLDVELHACEAWGRLGKIPRRELALIKSRAKNINPKRVLKIEEKVKHDVIAFLTAVAEKVGPASRFIHMGMTSSDVLDTAFAFQLKTAADIILKDIDELLRVLKKKSEKVKSYPFDGPVILVLRDFSSLFDASTIMKHTKGIKVPPSGYKEVWYLTRSAPTKKWDELVRLK